jgi:lysophospholipid acyltransferase (LPLAT)-like uncharacterized protein
MSRKSPLKGKWGPLILIVEQYLAAIFLFLLGHTWRVRFEGWVRGERVVYSPWHCHLVPILYCMRFQHVGVLVSSSKDGQLGAGPAGVLGFTPIRGSSSKGGMEAARELIEHSRQYAIGIIPDGPKGPARVLKPGVVRIARQCDLPIRGIAVQADRIWILPTWDRMEIPKPFARVIMRFGEPIDIPVDEPVDISAARVQSMMDLLNTIE